MFNFYSILNLFLKNRSLKQLFSMLFFFKYKTVSAVFCNLLYNFPLLISRSVFHHNFLTLILLSGVSNPIPKTCFLCLNYPEIQKKIWWITKDQSFVNSIIFRLEPSLEATLFCRLINYIPALLLPKLVMNFQNLSPTLTPLACGLRKLSRFVVFPSFSCKAISARNSKYIHQILNSERNIRNLERKGRGQPIKVIRDFWKFSREFDCNWQLSFVWLTVHCIF